MPEPIVLPAPDPVVPPVVPPAPAPQDSSVIQAMRAQLDAVNREKREAEQKLADAAAEIKKRDDALLSETERLKREIDDLKPLRDAHGKYTSTLQTLCETELATVPDEKRAAVEALATSSDPAERLNAIKAAKLLLGSAVTLPTPVGTALNPGSSPPAPSEPTRDVSNLRRLGDVVFKRN